ncbi:MAG: hypothetical protein R2932_50235 [Caldilineaceae bacterium]
MAMTGTRPSRAGDANFGLDTSRTVGCGPTGPETMRTSTKVRTYTQPNPLPNRMGGSDDFLDPISVGWVPEVARGPYFLLPRHAFSSGRTTMRVTSGSAIRRAGKLVFLLVVVVRCGKGTLPLLKILRISVRCLFVRYSHSAPRKGAKLEKRTLRKRWRLGVLGS